METLLPCVGTLGKCFYEERRLFRLRNGAQITAETENTAMESLVMMMMKLSMEACHAREEENDSRFSKRPQFESKGVERVMLPCMK